MINEVYFTVFVAGSLAVVLIGYGITRLSRKYPDTALAGFASFDDIREYYRFALDSMREHKWLRAIPVWLVLSYYFMRIPAFIIGKRALEAGGLGFESQTTAVTAGRIWVALVAAARALFNGHQAFFFPISPLVLILVLVILIRPSALLGRLGRYAGGRDVKGFAFLERTLSTLHSLLLLTGIPLAVALVLRRWLLVWPLVVATAVVFRVTVVFLVAVVSGFILFYARRLASGESPDRRAALLGSLSVTGRLFYLYLILVVPLSVDALLPAMLMFPASVATVFGVGLWNPVMLPLGLWFFLGLYWPYIAAFLTAAIVCTPFALLKGDLSIGAVFATNFRFIGRHFVKYLTFICSGVVLLFLPHLLAVLLEAVVPANTTAALVVDMLTDTVGIYLSVLFLLALLKFYLDNSREVLFSG